VSEGWLVSGTSAIARFDLKRRRQKKKKRGEKEKA
jgi:hypothetical protein